MIFSRQSFVLLILYSLLNTAITLFAGGISILAGSLFYIIILLSVNSLIDNEHRTSFLWITSGFLLFYSVVLVLSHYLFIENPFNDSYINIDEFSFFTEAFALSKLTYVDIWQTAFSEFRYSGSPLFYAWMGTLQGLIDLNPFYSLLFQKFNVVFLGSFIPGIVYLMCSRITDRKNAFKAAIVYGLFSFTLFYSVGLMRDIHIALIYAIALYIITGDNYTLKNYLILIALGLMAYFIRFENGLFFLAIIGVWMVKSSYNNKFILGLGSAAGLAGVIILLGGVDMIYNMALGTIQSYSERGFRMADQGSLGIQLRSLPVPINYIGMTAFGQIAPFPFWLAIDDSMTLMKVFFYSPKAIAALFWFVVWMRIITNYKKAIEYFKKYKLVVAVVLLYLVMVTMAQSMARRLMAVYPIIFMGYIYINNRVIKGKEVLFSSIVYSLLLVVYLILKM